MGRPVYVLGAGFSAAIHEAMPVTDDIGREIAERLASEIDVSDLGRVSFEDWLTVRVAPMPFLDGPANARRLADSRRVIAVIADIIDERTAFAAEQEVPKWLRQLISIWHAEQALIITFNYDSLLERAINDVQPSEIREGVAYGIPAERIVRPAPPAPPVVTLGDMNSTSPDSLQILKVHGSVNWFWDSGDPIGSSLRRTRERSRFAGIVAGDADATGTLYMDRFLIPPVSTKSEFYTPPLTKILWRSAGAAVRHTERLTLFGYSMPATDRATTELLRGANKASVLHVVDRYGAAADGIAQRSRAIGASSSRIWSGDDCVESYVGEMLALHKLQFCSTVLGLADEEDDRHLILTLPTVGGNGAALYGIAYDQGVRIPVEIASYGPPGVAMTVPEAALAHSSESRLRENQFLKLHDLRNAMREHSTFAISTPAGEFEAFTYEEMTFRENRVLRLHFVPS